MGEHQEGSRSPNHRQNRPDSDELLRTLAESQPGIVQALDSHALNYVFNKQFCKYVPVSFDDILIYSRTWEEHMRHLDEVLGIMEAQSLFAKLSKCEFGLTEILYLGHVIGANGVKVHQEKIQAMLDWPPSRNVSELRGFLGLCAYYRRFVKGYSQLAAPLTNLTGMLDR
ncbi:uncharacterized mitochondrial protein AtMg00860-like [Cryptomeria japonica]|uniref:uncharacterized mitochondrial protein AtMg00860-like n=1 Tax=Cryptomeria japonica TaxID=3369 RepID=UPI0027DA3EC5|nr:uncharacterized mitochondrial protein AtMg00860-like [Cryptomeria japonica]